MQFIPTMAYQIIGLFDMNSLLRQRQKLRLHFFAHIGRSSGTYGNPETSNRRKSFYY